MKKITAVATAAFLAVSTLMSTSTVFAVNNYDATDSSSDQYNTQSTDSYNSTDSIDSDSTDSYNTSETNSYNRYSNTEESQQKKVEIVKVDVSWFNYNHQKKSYTIHNEAQLRGLASLVNEKQIMWKPNRTETFEGVEFKLAKDIKLKHAWNPIGRSSGITFKGTFDGQGHTISNVNITTGNDYTGLFGYLSGTVKNLNVKGKVESGSSCTGLIAGRMEAAGAVRNCITEGNVKGKDKTGGVVGESRGGVISGCLNHGTVKGTYKVGGIVGENFGGRVLKSGNYASVKSTTRNIGIYGTGGVAGRSVAESSVVGQCFNKGEITSATEGTGGVVGYCNARGARISNCYNTGNMIEKEPKAGKLKAKSYIGGVVGIDGGHSVRIRNCYNAGTGLGADYSGGVIGHYTDSDGIALKNAVKNNYYINTNYKYGIGRSLNLQGLNIENVVTGISSGSLGSYTSKLGKAYMKDSSGLYGNSGYPVFRWQQPISDDEKEYLDGVSLDAQKRLDNYMSDHTDSLLIGQIIIDIFNTTNLVSDKLVK